MNAVCNHTLGITSVFSSADKHAQLRVTASSCQNNPLLIVREVFQEPPFSTTYFGGFVQSACRARAHVHPQMGAHQGITCVTSDRQRVSHQELLRNPRRGPFPLRTSACRYTCMHVPCQAGHVGALSIDEYSSCSTFALQQQHVGLPAYSESQEATV